MKSSNKVEILIDGHEMGAHRFFQTEHAKLSGELYREEVIIERKTRIHTGKGMSERQLNTFLLANKSAYTQLGTLERIMHNLRTLAKRD